VTASETSSPLETASTIELAASSISESEYPESTKTWATEERSSSLYSTSDSTLDSMLDSTSDSTVEATTVSTTSATTSSSTS